MTSVDVYPKEHVIVTTTRSATSRNRAGGLRQVSTKDYYSEYHGHQTRHLEQIHATLRNAGCSNFVYLAGDSSLDNKHWFFDDDTPKERQLTEKAMGKCDFIGDAVNGYESVLNPPKMVKDVCYWFNQEAAIRYGRTRMATLMASIEESTVRDRESGLLPQDKFIRDNISENDCLVVSVGGNDVALRPTMSTILNMGLLTASPNWMIERGCAPGFSSMLSLFRDQVGAYVRKLCAKTTPKKVLVCMIYYLDETPGGSWADNTLALLGYNSNPAKLQLIIRSIFRHIEQEGLHDAVDIPGMDVAPFPLFDVLDGKDSSDYEQRVEPSVTGGQKMASALIDALPEPS